MDDTKRFFYPSLVEELLSSKTTSINQEKEVDFQQRKMTMERDALKEEKLRAEKEKGHKFLEDEFNFKGEDEEIAVPDIKATDNLKFKTLNKTKKDSDQVFSVVEYAKLPDNIKDLFNLKKAEKPSEEDSIQYLNFDKSAHPNLHKYSRKVKVRKAEANIVNLYDINMKSLLTSAEISKRAELLAKLYMKYHYDEEKYSKALDDEKKMLQKRSDKAKKEPLNLTQVVKKGDTNQNSGLLMETQTVVEKSDPNIINLVLPPGATLIKSEKFPPPPDVKLPSQEEIIKKTSSTAPPRNPFAGNPFAGFKFPPKN